MKKINFFWFRRDLRLNDNHGLYQALQSEIPVRCVFIFDKNILSKLPNKDARVQFIHQELHRLKSEISDKSNNRNQLEVWYGDPVELWRERIAFGDVNAIFCNRDYEPSAILRDQKVHQFAMENGCTFYSFKDQCIYEGSEVVKDDGKPYTVFTPYSRKWMARLEKDLIQHRDRREFTTHFPSEHQLQGLDLINFGENVPLFDIVTHKFKLTLGLVAEIPTLESMGFEAFSFNYPDRTVSQQTIANYSENRDFPGMQGTSRLGLHFRFGTISIREKLAKAINLNQTFVNELIWRDFYMQILWHFPHVVSGSFKPQYDLIQWRNNELEFEAWKNGETGYPIVDAGMRELNTTGFMHNRVRMIVASFLTKHLLIDWRWGEAYFAEKLLDFELASNNGGWQWAAGSGVDAAPYFRIFNPTAQTDKFDKQKTYIRKWVPEFDSLTYTGPIVDHAHARVRCLETYDLALKNK